MTSLLRTRLHHRASRLGIVAVVAVMSLSACGGDDSDSDSTTPDAGAPAGDDAAPVDDAADTGVSNPAIAAVLALDADGVCALMPAADVGQAVGQTIDVDPTPFDVAGLSASCAYLVDNGTGTDNVATFGFDSASWKLLELSSDADDWAANACTVAGLDAQCVGDDDISPNTVTVKLGTDDDGVLTASSDLGLDQAKALAEAALAAGQF